MSELGLFPLPIVLLPTERVPLHIFEPRYLELIDECRETGREFGLIFATDEGAVHEIGTRATVEEVLVVLSVVLGVPSVLAHPRKPTIASVASG